MPKRFEDLYEENKGRALRSFEASNPRAFERLQGNAQALNKLGQVLEERREGRAQLEANLEASRQLRIADQVVEVFVEHHGPNPPRLEAQFGDAPAVRERSFREEAAQRVSQDDAKRLADYDARSEQLVQEVLDAADSRDRAPHHEAKAEAVQSDTGDKQRFKAEIHAIVERAKTASDQARRVFARDRLSLIDQARAHGSEHPERDVAIAQREVMERIGKQEHREIHEAFQRHGWDRTNQEVLFYGDGRLNTRAFEQKLDGIEYKAPAATQDIDLSRSMDDED